VLSAIVEAYTTGTRDNIHADADGLIIAGDSQTQLTWMDAKCNGVTFTPRYGKPVEVNALWINALRIMAETSQESSLGRAYEELASRAQESFNRLFWNETTGCLNDCILPDGKADPAIRPNQIFAVSLPFGSLDETRRRSVVEVVEKELLTPFGLRSLSPRDSRYRGRYEGDQFQRDGSYHQGTVWGYLIGPFVEAYLKVNGYSAESRTRAGRLIEPLLEHFTQGACIGSVSEIFDGDPPNRPNGCIAQAWSVAELLRCKKLIQQQ
jgi:predicted glycogen debranching enzyme